MNAPAMKTGMLRMNAYAQMLAPVSAGKKRSAAAQTTESTMLTAMKTPQPIPAFFMIIVLAFAAERTLRTVHLRE